MKKYFELILVVTVIFGAMVLTGYVLKDATKAKSGIVKHLTGRV